MSELIGGYRPITPLKTAGSGSARWCIATRGLERFFLKQFLSPVFPVDESGALGRKQRERCLTFERRKQRLYTALSCVIGDTLVPVVDFFRFERRYFAVSEAVSDTHITAEETNGLNEEEKRSFLFELALCLQRLHTQGIVHADLKPEHVLLLRRPSGLHARLIDLDSGFLIDDPPQSDREMEGDPVYLAPEVFLRMTGQDAPLGPAVDTFAFGGILHAVWTGALPSFDHDRYTYLYEAALDGEAITLDDCLPLEWRDTVSAMLTHDPASRPSDAELVNLLSTPFLRTKTKDDVRPLNGLSRFMKT